MKVFNTFLVFVCLCSVPYSEAVAAPKSDKCAHLLSKDASEAKEAWKTSGQTLDILRGMVSGSEPFLHDLLTTSLANEFAWINGDPGGAKTYLSRSVFKAQLNSLKDDDKRIFLLQFHKLMTEGVITGFPKIKSMLDHGKYEIETSSALVGEQFIFTILDEAEKANPATLTALLSVLNERKAFLGSRVVNAMLSSGVITSNKTLAEFIQSSGDRPSFEALADRMAIKRHVPNQFGTSIELVGMYDKVKASQTNQRLVLPLKSIETLVEKVQLTGKIGKIATLITDLDGLFTTQADQSLAAIRRGENVPEYFPANQFSNRSDVRILKTMKASFIAKQLMDGVSYEGVRLEMDDGDLDHLATAALYGGPSQIRLKRFKVDGVQVRGIYGEPLPIEIQWSPYEDVVYLYDHNQIKVYSLRLEKGALKPTSDFSSAGIEINSELSSAILKGAQKINSSQKIDLAKPQFEVDGETTRLLAKKTIPARTRHELETIQRDMQAFVAQLNALTTQKDSDPAVQDKILVKLKERKRTIEEEGAKVASIVAETKASAISQEKKIAIYYDATQTAFKHLKQMYPELDHAANAFFVSALATNHLYVFGPPGGAKTSMAREILGALIRWENLSSSEKMSRDVKDFAGKFTDRLASKDKDAAELFFLQFHKLIPEGVIVGFPKLQEQIDSGRLEFDLSTSLAHEKFIFAILDEVEKGNPAVLTTLLSVLNEREVFAGNNVFKTGLRIAALTSNKMPSEFLDYFEDDRPTGTALLDRTLNKVYVSNKFSSKESLAAFLLQIEAGLSPRLNMPLPIEELRPLADKVQVDDYVKHVLAEIYDDFTARRLEKEEKSLSLHREDPAEFPDYYVKATSGSNRTFIALLDQVRTSFIIDQLMRGVAFDELKYDVELKDIAVFLKGLGYWTPVVIEPQYDKNGFLKFALSAPSLQKLKDSSYVNQRNRYTLAAMYEEATDFVEIANNKVGQLLINYRQVIAKFPHLFPSLFGSDKARDQFVEKQGSK